MFTMKIYNKFKKFICYTLLLIVLSLACSGCRFSITTEGSISSQSSSKSSSSKGSSSSTGNFALKYKDHTMDFDEYLYLMSCVIFGLAENAQNVDLTQFVNSGNVGGVPVVDWIKQTSIQRATNFLMAREKLEQLGKDLDENSKKWVQNFSSDKKTLEFAATLKVSQSGVKAHAEDYVKFTALQQKNIDLDSLESDKLTLNNSVIEKIDISDLTKRVEECIKNGAKLIDEKNSSAKNI